MLLAAALWLAVVVLVVPVVLGPERYVRKIVLNLRPGTVEPTKAGYALLFWRNLAVLVVVVLVAVGATPRATPLPTDAEVLRDAEVAAALVPPDELDPARLDAELWALTDGTVAAEDVSSDFPDPEPLSGGAAATLSRTFAEVRALTAAERADDPADPTEQVDPAACVVVERVTFEPTGVPGYETPEDQIDVSVRGGRCVEAD